MRRDKRETVKGNSEGAREKRERDKKNFQRQNNTCKWSEERNSHSPADGKGNYYGH